MAVALVVAIVLTAEGGVPTAPARGGAGPPAVNDVNLSEQVDDIHDTSTPKRICPAASECLRDDVGQWSNAKRVYADGPVACDYLGFATIAKDALFTLSPIVILIVNSSLTPCHPCLMNLQRWRYVSKQYSNECNDA